MQIKSILLPWLGALAVCVALSSCKADKIEEPDAAELYNREFLKEFGVPDPNHDWNMAERATVTVNTSRPTDVKIYATIDGKTYLYASYNGVTGSQELGVDVPKGVKTLIVNADGVDRPVAVGSTVSLGSRGTVRANDLDNDQVNITAHTGLKEYYKNFTVEEVLAYREHLPESNRDGDIGNLGIVTQNFVFKATKSFVIYPVYWRTSQNDTFGIYYRNVNETDPGNFKKVPLFQNKNSVDGLASTGEDEDWHTVTWEGEDFTSVNYDWSTFAKRYIAHTKGETKEYTEIEFEKPGEWTDNKNDYEALNHPRVKGKYLTWADTSGGDESYAKEYELYRSHGILIELTSDQTYGFYLIHGNGTDVFYSEAIFNETIEGTLTDKDPESSTYNKEYPEYKGVKAPHFGVYETTDSKGNKRMILGAEDWKNQSQWSMSDNDLNDIIVYVENVTPDAEWPPFETVNVDKKGTTPYEWVVACEDLGTTDDFDFNDVVFGVSNYRETTDTDGNVTATVDVRAMAAGGTLPIYLCRNGVLLNGGKEFHAWFSGSHSSTTVINANPGGTKAIGETITIEVERGFTMSCCQNVTTPGENGNMGGFSVQVKKDATTVTEIHAPNLDKSAGFEAPQMICCPVDWCWPTERTHILTPYADFGNWITDQAAYANWHANRTGGYYNRTDIPNPVPDTPTSDNPWGGSNGDGNDNTEEGDNAQNFELTLSEKEDNPLSWITQRRKYSYDWTNVLTANFEIEITNSDSKTGANYDFTFDDVANSKLSSTGQITGNGRFTLNSSDLEKLKEQGYFYIIFYKDPGDVTITITGTKSSTE